MARALPKNVSNGHVQALVKELEENKYIVKYRDANLDTRSNGTSGVCNMLVWRRVGNWVDKIHSK